MSVISSKSDVQPPRGEKVNGGMFLRTPSWIRKVVAAAFPDEKFRSAYGALSKIYSLERSLRSGSCHGIFDHVGYDRKKNLITEPYAGNCPECLAVVPQLAARLGVHYSITRPSWHAPQIDECVRITFFPPGGAREDFSRNAGGGRMTPITDLREYVLAENVVVSNNGKYGPPYYTTFDFLCRNCGRRHWATEIADERFNFVGWALDCGQVHVRMPWAETPERDERSIYGKDKVTSSEVAVAPR